MAKNDNSSKVVLVTGASSGIGYEVALQLKAKNFIVYGAARRADKLKALEDRGIKTVILDVTDEDSMNSCVDTIVKKEGKIDILINNAGYGSYGAVEDVEIDEARRQFEVNLFGLASLTQKVLPYMRDNHFGRIINTSSMGGKAHTKFGAWYHATKFAVEGFSDCLRIETKEFGVDVVLVEPGMIRTNWGMIAADNLEKTSADGAYEKQASKYAKNFRKSYSSKRLTSPARVAQEYVKVCTARKPKTRYLVGTFSHALIFFRRILTDRMYDRIIASAI
jgi:short-subunit dehydrogenase